MTAGNPARETRITTATINSIRPCPAVYVIRDTAQVGFHIIVLPSGQASYYVGARLGGTGNIKKFRIGGVKDIELEDARERAKEVLDRIRSGIDPLLEKRMQLHEGKTLKLLIEDYFNLRDLKPRTKEQYLYIADRLFTSWLNKRAVDITRHEIQDWYAKGNKHPAQTDKAYRFLNSLMTFAMGREIIKENPCKLVTNAKMRYRIKSRTDHIEVNYDLPKFLKVFIGFKFLRDSQMVARDAMLLILTTGLRLNEAASLQWKQIDFDRKIFTILDTKNRRDHIVPLTPLTYSLLRYRQEHGNKSAYVFRIKGESASGYLTSFQKTLTNICNEAGVPEVSAHDLRRTFATVLNSVGVGYVDMKHLMNHKSKDITAHYSQPDIEKLRNILYQVVDFYDNKIPFPEMKKQGYSPFSSGVLQYMIYKKGDVSFEPLDDPHAGQPGYEEYMTEQESWDR